jgi:hypothetical protein
MSDPVSSPPPDETFIGSRPPGAGNMPDALPSAPSIAYRPISGFAIAGLAAACLFALLMLVVVGVAFTQSTPFFLHPLVLLLPAAGLILSLLARNQIRGSEGTRAGERLARTGLWISLLTGLGYFVYYFVTGLAVTGQSNSFLMDAGPDTGFFPHLEKAASNRTDFYAAFLLTLPPGGRGNVRAEDEPAMLRQHDMVGGDGAPSHLHTFRNSILARVFTNASAGGKPTVEPLGGPAWGFENHSYYVRRSYRVAIPEAVVEFSVLTRSDEGEAAGQQRKWYVDLKQIPPARIMPTPLGENLAFLRAQAMKAVERWRSALNAGESWELSKSFDKTAWNRLTLKELQVANIKARTKELFEGKEHNRLGNMSFPPPSDPLTDWTMIDGKLRIGNFFKLSLEPRANTDPTMLEGRIFAETKAAFDPRNMTAEPEWVIDNMNITRATPISPKKGPFDAKPVP